VREVWTGNPTKIMGEARSLKLGSFGPSVSGWTMIRVRRFSSGEGEERLTGQGRFRTL